MYAFPYINKVEKISRAVFAMVALPKAFKRSCFMVSFSIFSLEKINIKNPARRDRIINSSATFVLNTVHILVTKKEEQTAKTGRFS